MRQFRSINAKLTGSYKKKKKMTENAHTNTYSAVRQRTPRRRTRLAETAWNTYINYFRVPPPPATDPDDRTGCVGRGRDASDDN